jgi:hypothetical protein
MSDTVLLVILYILLALILVFTVFLALGYLDPKVERWNKRMKKILKRAKKNQNNWTEMQLLKLDVKELLDKMIPAYEKGYLRKSNELNQVINLLKEVLQATDANSMIWTFTKTKDLLQLLVLMKYNKTIKNTYKPKLCSVLQIQGVVVLCAEDARQDFSMLFPTILLTNPKVAN